MKIGVVGIGYVGLSNAVLLAKDHEVVILDVDVARVTSVNAGQAPFLDIDISARLARGGLNLCATTQQSECFLDANYVIVATPTNYDPTTSSFDRGFPICGSCPMVAEPNQRFQAFCASSLVHWVRCGQKRR
ncbi:MAG: hypothetical protein HOM87_11595 [Proteobacteria bacterium]|nr:hypothetical protein [Pseudomonadota bacterium]